MIGVYVKDGKLKGERGFLFAIDSRTAEVVTRTQIIRVDRAHLRPLTIAQTFTEIDKYVEELLEAEGRK